MTEDARFEDGADRPLNLGAFEPEDLQVISALVQDAVLTGEDIKWERRRRRLALLVNRVRWEDADAARKRGRRVERIRSLLLIENVLKISSQGIQRDDNEMVLSILSIFFQPSEDGAGYLDITLAGDGTIRAEVEALEIALKDVTRPYQAVSGKLPEHPE